MHAGDLSYWMDESFIYSLFVGECCAGSCIMPNGGSLVGDKLVAS